MDALMSWESWDGMCYNGQCSPHYNGGEKQGGENGKK